MSPTSCRCAAPPAHAGLRVLEFYSGIGGLVGTFSERYLQLVHPEELPLTLSLLLLRNPESSFLFPHFSFKIFLYRLVAEPNVVNARIYSFVFVAVKPINQCRPGATRRYQFLSPVCLLTLDSDPSSSSSTAPLPSHPPTYSFPPSPSRPPSPALCPPSHWPTCGCAGGL